MLTRANRLIAAGARQGRTAIQGPSFVNGGIKLAKIKYSTEGSNQEQSPKLKIVAKQGPTIKNEKVANLLRKVFSGIVPQYQSVTIGKNIYNSCKVNSKEFTEFWVARCLLAQSFQSWFSVQSLFVWMCLVKVRNEKNAKLIKQQLVDNFFEEAEEKIKRAGIKSGKLINDSLKDLMSSYMGSIMSYDEGLIKDDCVLAGAIWRNLLMNSENASDLEFLVHYVREQLYMLDNLSSEDFILGNFKFKPLV